MTSFRLAPMSPMIRGLTLILLAIPLVFFAAALVGTSILVAPTVLVVTMYSWADFGSGPPCLSCIRMCWKSSGHSSGVRLSAKISRGFAQSTIRSCGVRSDGVFAWELADYGADSVGCGLSSVELFKCTSRVPMTSFGSSFPMGGLGSSRQNIPRPLFEPCRASRMQSPNNQPSRSAYVILLEVETGSAKQEL